MCQRKVVTFAFDCAVWIGWMSHRKWKDRPNGPPWPVQPVWPLFHFQCDIHPVHTVAVLCKFLRRNKPTWTTISGDCPVRQTWTSSVPSRTMTFACLGLASQPAQHIRSCHKPCLPDWEWGAHWLIHPHQLRTREYSFVSWPLAITALLPNCPRWEEGSCFLAARSQDSRSSLTIFR